MSKKTGRLRLPPDTSPADRFRHVMGRLATGIGPQLCKEQRLGDWRIIWRGEERRLADLKDTPEFRLSAKHCLKIILGRGRMLFPALAAERVQGKASILSKLSDAAERADGVSEASALRAGRVVKELLTAFGLDASAAAMDGVILPPALSALPRLREVLTSVARAKELITYEDVRLSLDLLRTDESALLLGRLLCVLLGQQLLANEPPLSALIVSRTLNTPEDDFHLAIGVPRRASDDIKRAAHDLAVRRVHEHDWTED